jgi:AraC family transcriptional regulator
MHRYLNRLRLQEALQRVAAGADLGEVGISLGFSSHSHFTAAFRKEFGVTPSQARSALTPRGCPASAGARPRGRLGAP